MPSWVSKPPKRARRRAAAAAGDGALCFLLYPSRVADDISLFNPQSNFCNMYFSVVISPNLFFSLQFSKVTVFSLFSLFSVYSVS
jgi:hypothetical protein